MIQVYTGNGKGKTTAALGLALRAVGAGKKVYICQFIKGRKYSELLGLKKLNNITIEQFGRGCFIKGQPTDTDMEIAQRGLEKVERVIRSKKFDLVILDEINNCLDLKIIKIEDVLGLIDETPRNVELVLTGRNAPKTLIAAADLVSEVREIKHYYNNGIKARKGIEY